MASVLGLLMERTKPSARKQTLLVTFGAVTGGLSQRQRSEQGEGMFLLRGRYPPVQASQFTNKLAELKRSGSCRGTGTLAPLPARFL